MQLNTTAGTSIHTEARVSFATKKDKALFFFSSAQDALFFSKVDVVRHHDMGFSGASGRSGS